MQVEAFLESGSVCDQAKQLVEDARREFKRFSDAFFAVVVAAAIALVLAIIFLALGKQLTGVVTGVSGVVTSGAAIFIKSARKDAKDELTQRLNAARRICKDAGEQI